MDECSSVEEAFRILLDESIHSIKSQQSQKELRRFEQEVEKLLRTMNRLDFGTEEKNVWDAAKIVFGRIKEMEQRLLRTLEKGFLSLRIS